MSTHKHTPEPWQALDEILIGPGHDPVFIASFNTDPYWQPYGADGVENAARVAACVNACAGINPEAVPDLLDALCCVVRWHREHDSGAGELFGRDYVTTSILAIAKAEGHVL